MQVGNVTAFYSTGEEMTVTEIIRKASVKIITSPLYRSDSQYRVYLCDSPICFTYFANTNYEVGGIAYVFFNGNTFIRPSIPESNKIIRFTGEVLEDSDRPLSYYIAHELTHTMTVNRTGRVAYSQMPVWIQEGYADYVAKGSIDLVDARVKIKNDDPKYKPQSSGLYLKYHAMVQYLLEEKKISVEDLLNRRDDGVSVISDLLSQ